MAWNLAIYKLFGGNITERLDAIRLAELERRSGSQLPPAVREWFAEGGDEQLARLVHNQITDISDLSESRIGRFLDSGYLLLETDSQHCCQWVTPVHAVEDDPPVYLIDPDDYACRGLARLLLTHPERLTSKQRSLRDDLTAACPEMVDLADLIRDFADLLRPRPGNADRLDEWIAAVHAADLPQLHAFTRGLDQDWDAIRAALTLPYHNGGTEGVNTKTQRIMRQMHGRAGFPCYATESCSDDPTSATTEFATGPDF